ncbi:MAG: hypothetical protein ABSD49_14970 [Candidatus Bathyarchaeia archaeon]
MLGTGPLLLLSSVLRRRPGSLGKRRLDITVSRECKETVDRIIDIELRADATDDRPGRTKSAILEMLIRKGVKTWEAERKANQVT